MPCKARKGPRGGRLLDRSEIWRRDEKDVHESEEMTSSSPTRDRANLYSNVVIVTLSYFMRTFGGKQLICQDA